MTQYNWANVEKGQLNPLFARQVIHAEKVTVARIYMEKGCIVPEHAHHNEQVSMVLEGKLLFHMEDGDLTLQPGDVLHIPPHAKHKVTALEKSFAIDIFSPTREDWRTGDDAYLRR